MITVHYGTREDDTFYFSYSDVSEVVFAGRGDDWIEEGGTMQVQSDDVFFGGAGDDFIISRSGNDHVGAGRGDDVVELYGQEVVTARGGKGFDILNIYVDLDTGDGPRGDIDPPPHRHRGFEEVNVIYFE